MDKHRIIVLGGGYTGVVVAGQLARRVRRSEASVTLVTGNATRDERMRWHQLAAGESYPQLSIAGAVKGSGVDLEIARVERLDLGGRSVLLADGRALHYDSLVVALGSVIDFGDVPGARENAHGLTDAASIEATARTLAGLPDGSPIVVVGGGLTGIELVTEIAESHPRLDVTIVGSHAPGDWLSVAAQRHLQGVFDRLAVGRVVARVAGIGAHAVTLDDGRELPSALTFWAGGFRANPVVAASGLEADELGRAYVDESFRSVSHPDVWVVGDAARVPDREGVPLKMGCRTGAFMALTAPRKIVDGLSGRRPAPFSGRYFAECISLGRRDALLQWLSADGTTVDRMVTGLPARFIKEYVHRGNLFTARHPGPYFSVRRAHLEVTTGGRREMIEA
jgi:NADH dehydrogenase